VNIIGQQQQVMSAQLGSERCSTRRAGHATWTSNLASKKLKGKPKIQPSKLNHKVEHRQVVKRAGLTNAQMSLRMKNE